MNRLERIYQLHNILNAARRPVPMNHLMERMECTRATVNRVIREMRLYLGAPIEYDRERNGYFYDQSAEHPYELPGLWFNASELYALLAMQKLLSEVQPGLLESHLAPLRKRIEGILASERLSGGEIARRVRILHMAARPAGERFQTVAGALMQRWRLRIHYHGRGRDEVTECTVSPQRLVHYRDNWYLDAWCHNRRVLRTFSIERIRHARLLDQSARNIADARLDRYLTTSYGIFAGPPRATAVLRFSPERTRWVADETWHPEQEGRFLQDGRYELRIPHSDPRELIMDILKYGPDVEVVTPKTLRRQVADRLRAAAVVYT